MYNSGLLASTVSSHGQKLKALFPIFLSEVGNVSVCMSQPEKAERPISVTPPLGDDKSLGHGHAMEGITTYLFYIRWYNRSAASFDKYASSTLYDGVTVLTGVIHGVVGTDFNG